MCESIQNISTDGNVSLEFDCGGCLELTNKDIFNLDEAGIKVEIGKVYLGLCINYDEKEGIPIVSINLQFYFLIEYKLNYNLLGDYFPGSPTIKFTENIKLPIPIG